MDAKHFASLFESVTQMDEIVHGVREPSREFHIDAIGVTDIRKATGLSQAKFATLIGVQVGTLRNWEQGRREPAGPREGLAAGHQQGSQECPSGVGWLRRHEALHSPIMGNIIPNMGKRLSATKTTRSTGVSDQAATYVMPRSGNALADALFTQTQQRVFGLVFGQPDRTFTVSETIAAVGGGSGAVQRELHRLADSGLLTVQPVGNQKRYQANPDAPIFAELVGIVRKTVGLAQPLRDALSPLGADISAAFVYGSVAKQSETASSDIDVMVISDTLAYADVFAALEPAVQQLGRPINPTIYTRAQLSKRIKADNAFVIRVLEQPKIWLIGGLDDLTA